MIACAMESRKTRGGLMEGYTENGRRNRRRRPDWLCGHAPQEKAAPRIERIPAQGNRRGGAGAFRRQYHAGATDFRIRHEQHDVAYGHGAMRSGVVVRRADLRVAAGARLPADAQSRGIRRAAAVVGTNRRSAVRSRHFGQAVRFRLAESGVRPVHRLRHARSNEMGWRSATKVPCS